MFNESLRKKTFSIKQTITKSKSNTAAAAAAAAECIGKQFPHNFQINLRHTKTIRNSNENLLLTRSRKNSENGKTSNEKLVTIFQRCIIATAIATTASLHRQLT